VNAASASSLHAPPHRVRRALAPVLCLPLAEDQPATTFDTTPTKEQG
jgi:hypothetical protein